MDEVELVRAAVARQGPSAVGRVLEESEATIRHWAAGRRKPKPRALEKIRKVFGDGVPKTETGQKNGFVMPTPAPAPAEGEKGEAIVGADDPRENCIETLKALRLQLKSAKGDEVPKIANAITSSSRLLARLSGALDVTESQVLRSTAWAKLRHSIWAALAPYPEALKAVVHAVEQLET